ncbi:peptidase [Cytobacillus horneckiae]|uniref:peptidase n=1 Tax=Cytobacillus horneckiae TaxID=549687 RepID=UPI0039A2C7C7
MNNIKLNEMVIDKNHIDYLFQVNGRIKRFFSSDHLFFDFNYALKTIPESMLVIPFVANLAPLAWLTDSTIYIDQIDHSFYYCLPIIKKAYQDMYPNVQLKGNIIAKQIVENTYEYQYEAAQLFSGGLDALATFISIKDKQPILVTEYAWHNNEIRKSNEWEADKNHVTSFANSHRLENIFVQSNFGTFLNASEIDRIYKRKLGDSWWHGLHHGLAIISAAIPVAYIMKVKCIYIASSFFEGYKAKCASDPTIDNEIKFASGNVNHHGYDMNRQEKIEAVVKYCKQNREKINIRVCFRNEENCCNCEKCVRTIVGIIAEGEDPLDYGFNVPKDHSKHIRIFLKSNVKYFNKDKIMQWRLAQKRMADNKKYIQNAAITEWFINYNFSFEKKKSLLLYRVTNFFPIVKRRITEKLNKIVVKNA